jgi:hypothetical protein
MKESTERTVKVGFRRDPRKIFDELEAITADMMRRGWTMQDAVVEDGLGNIHLFFEREADAAEAASRRGYRAFREDVHEA